jgi:hypothetical protein
MKAPLLYLIATRLKNQIKSFFKSPGKLLYLVFLAGMIVLTIVGAEKTRTDGKSYRDIRELTAGITAFYSFMFVIISYKGFGNGASLFTMPDVNLVFTAPFRQLSVLFYGLCRQLGASLMVGLFIIFQYAWLSSAFNISYGVVLLILLGYAATVFLAQVTAMVIYAYSSADDGRKRRMKIAYIGIILAFAAYIAVSALDDRTQVLHNAVAAVNGPVAGLFPVSGWTGRVIEGVLMGSAGEIILGAGLYIAFLALLIILITYGKQDFYEDVLKSTEIAQSAITASKEGRLAEAAPSRVKVGKTGIGRGIGASVFYYKHLLENRRSRLLILEPARLIYAAIIIVMAVFTKGMGIFSVFTTATIFQIFIVALGRFNKELTKPYIYLIPEPPLKKMLFALAESLPSAVLESLIVFIPVAVIQGASPLDTALCIIARLSFTLLFTSVNIAVERLWGGVTSKSLILFLYFAMMVVMAVPGIVLAAVLATASPEAGQNAAIFTALTVCNIPIGLLVMFLCRGMLEYAELNNQ